jgi:hypothetical protein
LEDTLFTIANVLITPIWLLMAIAPRWRVTEVLVRGLWVPLLIATLYLILVLTNVGATDGDFFSLDGVAKLFANRHVLLAGWVHYLCFDLVVGSWEYRDALRNDIPHWMLVPCLFLTLMWGPAGFMLYLAVRFLRTRETLALT